MRDTQYELATARDEGKCVFCFFLEGKRVQASARHHVYSRDRGDAGWREHYTNLLCTCERHHPPPIITPGGSKSLGWVEEIARMANEKPINRRFVHEYNGPITSDHPPQGDRD